MSYTSNASTIMSHSSTDTSESSTPRTTRATTYRPPLILTYCYGSQMVYVAPGDDYDVCSFLPSQPDRSPPSLIDTSTQRAINIAVESFQELRDIDRDRIYLEVCVMHSHQRPVKIGRTAWPFIFATLARFHVVDVCVASPPPPPRVVPTSSSSDVGSTPYDPRRAGPSTPRTHGRNSAYRPQMPSSLLQPHSHTTRVVVDVVLSWSPQGRHSYQPR